jgi:hypothetical protein
MSQAMRAPERGKSVVIQHMVFPIDLRTTPVYLRYESIDPDRPITPETSPSWKRSAILIHQRTTVSFDAVFNQLPEAYSS